MSSTPYHRFQPPKTSKFGHIPPPSRIYINAKNPVIAPVVDAPIEPTPCMYVCMYVCIKTILYKVNYDRPGVC